jgi:16S rRNA (guanine527-N7)-methyltransferase
VDVQHIGELLKPFLSIMPDPEPGAGMSEHASGLSAEQLKNISTYIDLILRWNSRTNLTAIREPREIVTRHFGESLFAACYLFPPNSRAGADAMPKLGSSSGVESMSAPPHLLDVGSGAGFPGLPIRIWAPQIRLTLVESNHKKATFLREVVRALRLTDVDVSCVRAEDISGKADVVTLRGVERFETILPTAARLVAAHGRLAVLIGGAQVKRARELIPRFQWGESIPIPQSSIRVLMIGCASG